MNTHSRDRLRNLIAYMAQVPLSKQLLEILEDGKVKLKLKTPWHDGTSHRLLNPPPSVWAESDFSGDRGR
jgi:hypothetical protein